MTYLILKNEFSQIRVCFSIRALRRTSALNNDFSRRHLCLNPPALAGGRLSAILATAVGPYIGLLLLENFGNFQVIFVFNTINCFD